MNLSSVRVPVLSKAIMSTFPPRGIFLGSLTNIFFFWRYRIELLTAKVKIIGNSGGTTVVMIRIHLRNSFYLLLYSLSIPWSRTYADVMSEQTSRKAMIQSPSFCYILRLSAFATTFLISLPFEVSKPMVKTMPIHPLTGGLGMYFYLFDGSRIWWSSSSW